MCGIFGYFCRNSVSIPKVLELLQRLEVDQYQDEDNPLGGHGAGVCFVDTSGKVVIYKVRKRNGSPAKELSEIREAAEAESRIVIGHVRLASGDFLHTVKYPEAAQPYVVNCLDNTEVLSAHNGKVRNYRKIRRYLSKKHHFQSESIELIDSEVIPHFFLRSN